MIIPEKPNSRQAKAPAGESSQASDARSVMTQEPPPYTESGMSELSGPPPQVVPPNSRPAPAPGPSRYSPLGYPTPPQSQTSLHVPTSRGRARSLGTPQESTAQSSQPRYPSQHAPRLLPKQSPPKSNTQPPLSPPSSSPGRPVIHRRPNSLPGSQPVSPTAHARFASPPNPIADGPLPPQYCNHLVERKDRSSVRGTWYLDTSLVIPEPLMPDMSNFNGIWNEMDKKSVRQREKERKKRQGGGWGRKKIVDTTPPKPLKNEGVRPNLMLWSKDGGVEAEVHLVSKARDTAVIVAESHDGSVKLTLNAENPQPIRLFAIASDGSVRIRIPTTFEGAISMETEHGSVKISDGVKARMMTFTSTTKCARGYIGDWRAANFGSPTSSPTLSFTPSPQTPDSEPRDPFKNWAGPIAYLNSKDGSVSIAYYGEDTSTMFSKVMKSIKDGLLGLNTDDEDKHRDHSGAGGHNPATLPLPRGLAMQAYRAPPGLSQGYLQPNRRQIAGNGQSDPPGGYAHIPEVGGPGLFVDRTHGRMASR